MQTASVAFLKKAKKVLDGADTRHAAARTRGVKRKAEHDTVVEVENDAEALHPDDVAVRLRQFYAPLTVCHRIWRKRRTWKRVWRAIGERRNSGERWRSKTR